MGLADWGKIGAFLADKLPIQGRVERWRNERDNLKKEKVALDKLNLDINKAEDRKISDRIAFINKRLPELDQLLINKSS